MAAGHFSLSLTTAVSAAASVRRGTLASKWDGTQTTITPASTRLVGPSCLCLDWWPRITGKTFTSRWAAQRKETRLDEFQHEHEKKKPPDKQMWTIWKYSAEKTISCRGSISAKHFLICPANNGAKFCPICNAKIIAFLDRQKKTRLLSLFAAWRFQEDQWALAWLYWFLKFKQNLWIACRCILDRGNKREAPRWLQQTKPAK